MITGHKDTDLRLLLELDDREFFIFCGKDSLQFKNKYVNKLCKSESLWQNRLFKYYGEIYPEVDQTWKNLYLSLVVHLDKYKYRKDQSSFVTASENGHLSVVKYLMSLPKEYGIDPAAENNYAIRYASENGHLSVVKYLIGLPKEYKIDPAARDNYAIRYASANGHLDVVKYLISLPKEYKIDPAAKNNIAIRLASQNGHLEVVKYLIGLPKEYGINPDAGNNEAIKYARHNRHLSVVNYLLSLPKEYGVQL
jgi:sulfur relay (sulfurtransferase) DsrC/TusE family protein